MDRSRALPPIGAALAALALAAGCSAAPPDAAAPSPTPSPTTTTTAAPTTTTPAPTTTTAEPPTAADGTDLEACSDGNCEVLITGSAEIPVPEQLGSLEVVQDGSQLRIVTERPDGGRSEITLLDGGGEASGSLAEGVLFRLVGNPDGSVILTLSTP